jgi:hypothetical protein
MRAALASPAASFPPVVILNPGANPSPRAPLRSSSSSSAAAALSRGPCPSGRSSVAAAAAAATGDHWGAADHYHGGGGGGRAGSQEAGARAAHGVRCDVDVVSWRERRVVGSVAVAADVDTLWQVITDYERLADFIPNLVHRSAFLLLLRLMPPVISSQFVTPVVHGIVTLIAQ